METAVRLIQLWREARLLWIAKGYSIAEVAEEVERQVASNKRPDLADLHLSESTVARATRSARYVPRGFDELVMELPAKPGKDREAEIVLSGLRVMKGKPTDAKPPDPKELALALLAHFPTDEFALRLADALLAQARVANGNGSLLDVFAQAVAGRVPYIDPARLARILAKRVARAVPTLSFARLAFVGGVASIVACGAWFLLDRTHKPSPPPMALSVYVSAGSAPVIFDAGAFLGATNMGEKPLDQSIPSGPLPGQKTPPCDSGLYEQGINGGCWMEAAGAKPPCGRLFKSSDKCYRPIAEDPKKPVGSDARPAPAR